MKHVKILSVFALCLALVLSMGLMASAERKNDAGITAVKGTPVIDGEIDEIWATAEAQPVANLDKKVIPSDSATTGTLRVMWDESNLYVLIEVDKHGVQVFEAAAGANDENGADCAEVSFSMEGDFAISNLPGATKAGTGNVKVFTNGLKNGFGPYYSANAADVQGKMKVTATDKYVVEYALPWEGVTPAAGTTITFEVQINDCVDGARAGLVSWASTTGCWGWNQTDVHGALTLAAAAENNGGSGSGTNNGSGSGTNNGSGSNPGTGSDSTGLVIGGMAAALALIGMGYFATKKSRT